MAFNWKTFRTRSLTAAVFVIVMMAGLLWNEWSFFILFSIIHMGAWLEYQKLVSAFIPDYGKISSVHKYGILFGGWLLMMFFTNYELRIGITLTNFGFWVGAAFLILFPLVLFLESGLLFLKSIAFSIWGLLYISLPIALLIDLRTQWNEENFQLSLTLPLLIIFSLWINDTMAYIVGSVIGRTPLSPVSPKKTWEGTIGGVLLTIIIIAALAYYTERLSLVHASILAALASVSGTFGDLFESKLKRLAKVKDSGSIMPGHGGFLDRFDSLLFACVFCWVYIKLFLSYS